MFADGQSFPTYEKHRRDVGESERSDTSGDDVVLPLRPGGYQPVVYTSGANRVGDIRGFLAAGVPVGVAAPELNELALCELDDLVGSGLPVSVDSGAFSEVSVDPAKQRTAGLEPARGR